MPESKFAIPAEFQDRLRYRPSRDMLTDAEILETLTKHAPVTSEKNIWAFWHSGVTSMPGWCQRNVSNWIRLCGPSGWTIRILDSTPESPNNALKFLPSEMLPKSFVDGKMDGPYVGPHSADFLRGACLYLFGGVYMDVGIILVRDMDRICWKQLEDPASPFQVLAPWMYDTVIANHFVAARKGDPFIKRWHDLFVHLWTGPTNHSGLIETPLFAPLQDGMSFDNSRMSNFHWDFPATQRWSWSTSAKSCAGDAFHILVFDVLQENWGGEATLGFAHFGQRMFDLMNVRLDADRESQEYKDAYKLTWRLLTKSSMQKITHGKGLTNDVMLGVLWDMPENEGKDCAEGTFAELLRYGTINVEQTRGSILYVDAPRPAKTLKKGLLEA
ncbi:hypothetical protein LTR85_011317 [Meristemomyces frigidus]|nr:hypothetical protein LTR85_011317 [Meristemomyces frigidus]